jgi:hypothetical protein
MKKIAPEKPKRKEYDHLLTSAIFSSAKYQGKTDAELEKLYAEERKEEQRRKQASSEA